MAIAFDTAGGTRDTSHTVATVTQALTLAATSNRVLIAFTASSGSESCSVTWNGTETMTEVPTSSPISAGYQDRMFYLVNPTSGSHNLVATFGGTTNDHYLYGANYTGVAQTSPIHTSSNNTVNPDTSITVSTTTSIDQVWTVAGCMASATTLAAGTGSTLRGTAVANLMAIFDSNGPLSPGAHSMSMTFGSSQSGAILVSLKPNDLALSTSDTTALTDSVMVGFFLSVSDTLSGMLDAIRTFFSFSNQSKSSTSWTDQSKS